MNDKLRVLIANRGEIALRACNTCRHLGLSPIAIYSTADQDSLHVTAADEAICVGPPASRHSYLNQQALIHIAKASDCFAIYPGYGFLAENAEFARLCEENAIKFIGPSAQAIARMGDKATARATAESLGIAVVPGSDKAFTEIKDAIAQASEIGFPLLLKATAGGGGKGMRVVESAADFPGEFEQASREATEAFSNPLIYLERYFPKVRHIEVQILVDQQGNVQQLGERDCTLQRRHQKLLEESPSPAISTQQRKALLDDALSLVSGIQYEGAGTIEFIFDPASGQHYFIEMNTRIQVEHPVTEVRFGEDLIARQIQIAMGENLLNAEPTQDMGLHAIEFRINAENPQNNFMPSPGSISRWQPPTEPGVRLDTFVSEGATISPFYDSMVAKLIVTGNDRDEAIQNAIKALKQFEIEGIQTTRNFHIAVLQHPDFRSSAFHTRWVEDTFMPFFNSS